MPHDDFAFETRPGIPAPLPRDEKILWQGRPDTWALTRDAFAIRWVIGYFVVIVAWRAIAGGLDGGLAGALAWGLPYAGLGAAAVLVIWGLAWAQARGAVYTITTARVLMRVGAALPVTLNLPLRQIETADLDLRRDGTGTLAFTTLGDAQLSYLVLWPHLRPWHARKTRPALRCIPDAARVARLFAEAAEARLTEPVIARAARRPAATAEDTAAAPGLAPMPAE